MALFWLSAEAWAAIEPHLPHNCPGARRVDDQRVISSILHVLKVCCPWCDCPTEYGPSTTVYDRFNTPAPTPRCSPPPDSAPRPTVSDRPAVGRPFQFQETRHARECYP